MQQLFNDIQQRLAQNFPQLSLIDEDYGQLEAIETAEDTYPVTFPCALIGIPQIDWRNLGGGAQQGQTTIAVRIAIDCYDDTHFGSSTENSVAQRLEFARDINRVLHGFRSGTSTPLIRRQSRFYSRPHAVKVYELQYDCVVNDH